MIVPQLLPDELLRGYFWRFARLNGFRTDEYFRDFLRKLGGNSSLNFNEFPLCELLAQLTQKTVPQIVRDHTFIQFRHAVSYSKQRSSEGSLIGRNVISTQAMKSMRRGMYLCDACIAEDLSFHGFAYWRREHQLQGCTHCSKHAEPLGWVDAWRGKSILPTDFEADEILRRDFGEDNCEVRNSSEAFLEFWTTLAQLPTKVDQEMARKVLNERLRRIGISVKKRAQGDSQTSDHLFELYPRAWLVELSEQWRSKLQGSPLKGIDVNIVSWSGNAEASTFVLMLMSLFESAESFLEALSETQAQESKRHESAERYKKVNSELIRHYINQNGSLPRGQMFAGLTGSDARKKLKTLGYPELCPRTLAALKGFLRGRSSLSEAALSAGVSVDIFGEKLRVLNDESRKTILGLESVISTKDSAINQNGCSTGFKSLETDVFVDQKIYVD